MPTGRIVPQPTKLGLTAPAAEGIRDILQMDVDALKQDLRRLALFTEGLTSAINSITAHVEDLETITLELLNNTIQGNSDTMITTLDEKIKIRR